MITVQNPVHAKAYMRCGFSWKAEAGEKGAFLDYLGRPAVLLSLEGREFSQVYGEYFNDFAEEIFGCVKEAVSV